MTSETGRSDGSDQTDEVGLDPFPRRLVASLYVGSALNPVNSSLIATALVPIAMDLHVSVGRTAVLIAALYLASSIGQPTAGKLAEEFGPRRVFLTGIVIVLIGGVVGGFGHDLTTLVASRFLIGVGTSAGYPTAMLIIRRRAEHSGMRSPPGGVLGGLAIAGVATAAVGLPMGGVLVGAFGWRSTFLINVPVAIVAFTMAALWIPEDPEIGGSRRIADIVSRIDLLGILGFGGALSALLAFLLSLPRLNWLDLGIAVLLAVALTLWELRAKRPFLDLRMLASNTALTRTYVRAGLTLFCLYTILYGLAQWLEAGRGLSAEETGLLILPMTGVAALISRPISTRRAVRGPLVVAALASLAGSLGIVFLTTSTPIFVVVAVTLLFGVTSAASIVANQAALYLEAPAAQLGTASGLLRTFGYVGSIASSAMTGIVFHARVTDHGLHVIALIITSVSAIVLLMTVVDRNLAGHAGRASNLAQ